MQNPPEQSSSYERARAYGVGPTHRRVTTVGDALHGHRSALSQFRDKPGRWALIFNTGDRRCPGCGERAGMRYLQFLALEDGIAVIGECGANKFLHVDQSFSSEQEDALRRLGWTEPSSSGSPNWSVEARSDSDLVTLDRITGRTLREVFGCRDDDLLVISFFEFLLSDAELSA
jgi:hypothetical protein